MEYITFRDISLSPEESRDIIEFIPKKRNVNNYKDKLDAELLSAIKKSRNLTPKKPLKNPKSKNNQILTSRNKKRIDIIREFLKDLSYKVSKSELK